MGKRLLATSFLALFLYNMVAFNLLYEAGRQHAREQMKERITHAMLPPAALSNIHIANGDPVPRIDSKGEFHYQGHLYDLVQIGKECSGTLIVCVQDSREEQIAENLMKQIEQQNAASPQNQHNTQLLKSCLKQFIPVENHTLGNSAVSLFSPLPGYMLHAHNGVAEVPTPPPELRS